MDAIRRAAFVSVSRACGFCALAILCVMLGFAHEPQRSAQAGSLLFFALAFGLIWKAQLALRANTRKPKPGSFSRRRTGRPKPRRKPC